MLARAFQCPGAYSVNHWTSFKCAYPEEALLRRAVLMCNRAISKALLSLLPFFFLRVCSVGKPKMVLFASHQAMLKGGGEKVSANEEHGTF